MDEVPVFPTETEPNDRLLGETWRFPVLAVEAGPLRLAPPQPDRPADVTNNAAKKRRSREVTCQDKGVQICLKFFNRLES
jgi:hypothetical protein